MLVRCWWHKEFFPKEKAPSLFIFGANKKKLRNAVCEACHAKVVEKLKKESDQEGKP